MSPLPAPPVDHRHVRLGKLAAKHDPRDLLLLHYMTDLAAPPAAFALRQLKAANGVIPEPTKWGMLLNDRLGDCTQAARLHMHEGWKAANGSREVFPDDDALHDYEQSCGYNPADPSTDQGGVEADVLKWWRKLAPADRRITAYAACEPRNHDHVKLAVADLGGAYLGVQLPVTAQNQPVWQVVHGDTPDAAPGSWGGHAINVVAYGLAGLKVVTWGYEQTMTWEFFDTYVDECWAVIAQDWLNALGRSPDGVDLSGLLADLKAITA